MKPDASTDPAFDNYHAFAPLPADAMQSLKSPGCTAFTFQASFEQTFSTAKSLYPVSTILPQKAADAAKAKPVQQPLPASSSGVESCGWETTQFLVEVTFTRAILPAWCPPPKPTKPLSDILPERRDVENAGGSALGQYRAQLQRVYAIIVTC